MFEAMNAYMMESASKFDLDMMKVDAVLEASSRTLEINYLEAEYKVLSESGTSDDLTYLREEANASFSERAKATIEKIKEKILSFIDDMRDKLMDLMTSAKAKLSLDKLKKKLKMNPILSKKKISLESTEEQEKICASHSSKLEALAAKVGFGKVSVDDVAEIEESFVESHNRASSGTRGVVVTTLSNAVDVLNDKMKRAAAFLKTAKNNAKSFMDKMIGHVGDAADSAKNAVCSKVASLYSKIARFHISDLMQAINDLGRKLTGSGIESDEAVKESSTPEGINSWVDAINNLEVPSFSVENVPSKATVFESLMADIDSMF